MTATAGGMPVHPALGSVPLLSDTAQLELNRSIVEHGQQERIWLLDGTLIDGRARIKACAEAGTPVMTQDVPTGIVDPEHLVLVLNAHRIVLTAGQRAALAVAAAPLFTAEAKDRQREGARRGGRARSVDPQVRDALRGTTLASRALLSGQPVQRFDGRVRTRLAELLGVSSGYISQAARIAARSDRLYQDMLAGRVTLQEARRELGEPGSEGAGSAEGVTLRVTLLPGADSAEVIRSLACDPRVARVQQLSS